MDELADRVADANNSVVNASGAQLEDDDAGSNASDDLSQHSAMSIAQAYVLPFTIV
jgi:hypothetical protein